MTFFCLSYDGPDGRYGIEVFATSWAMAEMAAEMLPNGRVDGIFGEEIEA